MWIIQRAYTYILAPRLHGAPDAVAQNRVPYALPARRADHHDTDERGLPWMITNAHKDAGFSSAPRRFPSAIPTRAGLVT